MLGCRAAQDQGIAAVFDDGMCLLHAISARYLRDGLKAEHTSALKFSQPRQRVLQAVDRPQRVEFIDHKPESWVLRHGAFARVHRLENREPQPGGNNWTERGDLPGRIRHKQNTTAVTNPVAHTE